MSGRDCILALDGVELITGEVTMADITLSTSARQNFGRDNCGE